MDDLKKIARRAGLLYLAMGITGFYGILSVPMQLIIADAHKAVRR